MQARRAAGEKLSDEEQKQANERDGHQKKAARLGWVTWNLFYGQLIAFSIGTLLFVFGFWQSFWHISFSHYSSFRDLV
jgi:hypothetical protein